MYGSYVRAWIKIACTYMHTLILCEIRIHSYVAKRVIMYYL